MTPEEVAEKVNSLYNEIGESNNTRILRDLSDDPFEPINIEILGITYSFFSVEKLGQHDYYTGTDEEENCDFLLKVQRYDDFGADGEAEIREFVVSIDWLKGHMEQLYEYLHKDDKELEIQEEGLYPLSKEYYKKANDSGIGSKEYCCYHDIARMLHITQDNIKEAVIQFESNILRSEQIKINLEVLKNEQNVE